MDLVVLQAPATEPVSVAELKSFLQLVHDTEDAVASRCIAAARELVEAHTGRAIVTRHVRETLAGWSANVPVRLALAPVTQILAVQAQDLGGVFQPVAAAFDLDGGAGIIRFVRLSATGDLRLDYEAGFGDAGHAPPALRHAVMVAAAALFRDRDGAGLCAAARALADPFVRHRL